MLLYSHYAPEEGRDGRNVEQIKLKSLNWSSYLTVTNIHSVSIIQVSTIASSDPPLQTPWTALFVGPITTEKFNYICITSE